LPDGRGHGRITQNRQCKNISGCGLGPSIPTIYQQSQR